MDTFDVAIVGGGIVGHTLAVGLAGCAHKVALIAPDNPLDTPSDPSVLPQRDMRIIALAHRTVKTLKRFGLNLSESGATPIQSIQVTDKGHIGLVSMRADEYSLDAFGQVVSLAALTTSAAHQVAQAENCKAFPVSVTAIENKQQYSEMTLADGQVLSAKLIILADGGRSPLSDKLGFLRTQKRYSQTAVVFNVHTSQTHQNRAYERFTPNGPLALLPFECEINERVSEGNGLSVVWTLPDDVASKTVTMEDAQFINVLQSELGYRQGRIMAVSERASYPLSLSYTQRLTGPRCVVVGNAAQTLHPIAGQGFNLGLRDCITLIDLIRESEDPGSAALLKEYALLRTADREGIITLTDTLVHSFSNRHVPAVIARNLGLLGLSFLPNAMSTFVRQTTGHAGVKSKHGNLNAAG